ncbi:hypothetical protein WR25_09703 [Diploscapter pachys]|uniref:Uncharacterized protein n=1 Tax=Diploscapter pachys TaxID=2018661 RepID=A0A2A2KKL7_9BILA|nr:hypothetical protein WR25_09703 [Diploscapter pachys]
MALCRERLALLLEQHVDDSNTWRTSATTSLRENCAGDRLTETSSSSGQSRALRQASSSTQRPSGTIRSLCSAKGMKVSGPISPSWGCSQRKRASTETMRRSSRR